MIPTYLQCTDESKAKIDSTWHIIKHWSDASAAWQQGNWPAIPMKTVCVKGEWVPDSNAKRSKFVQQHAKTCFDEWEAAKQSAVAGDFQVHALSRIASTLSEADASKRREGMGNLREQALERISKRQKASHSHF